MPYPPESALSGIHDPAVHPVVWYRRVVRIDPVGTGRRVLLHFGAVDYRAEVWVNGQLVARHEGGHTPFHADITDALGEGGDQVVVVRAEDPTDDPAQPRGKQDWRPAPHDIWYHRTTGIWQPVWWEVVGDRHLTGLDWTPDLVRGQVTLEAGAERDAGRGHPARGPPHPTRPRCSPRPPSASAPRRRCSSSTCPRHGTARTRATCSGRRSSPTSSTPGSRSSRRTGRCSTRSPSYLGYRSVGVGDGRFLLNGRPYYLRLVLEQGYWPESHLAAPDDDALRARSKR